MAGEQHSTLPTVGFIGLGNMGLPMATNLLKAGYRLRVFNRTPERAASLVAGGAKLESRPAGVALPGGILITSLANDQVLQQLIGGEDGPITCLVPAGIHVSMSTISPATALKLAEDHERICVTYLAAPILGRPEVAAAGELSVFLAGPAAAKEKVHPLLRVIGQNVFDFGEVRRQPTWSRWRTTSSSPLPWKAWRKPLPWWRRTASTLAGLRTWSAGRSSPAPFTRITVRRLSRSNTFLPDSSSPWA